MCQEPFIRQLKKHHFSAWSVMWYVIPVWPRQSTIRQEKVRKVAWLVTSDSVSWDSLRTTKHVGYTVWWLQILMASMQHWLAMTTAYTCMNVRRTTERLHGINHSAHVTRRWTRDNDVVECGSASHLHVAMDTPVWGWRRKLVARRTLAQVKAARFGINCPIFVTNDGIGQATSTQQVWYCTPMYSKLLYYLNNSYCLSVQ